VKNKIFWVVDAVLFLGFLASFQLEWTGLVAHEWLGAAIILLALAHLLLHWSWVTAVAGRLMRARTGRSGAYFFLDSIILVGFLIISISGLVMSSWLNLTLSNYDAWRQLHIITSAGTLILIAAKIIAHRRWVVSIPRKWRPQRAVAGHFGPVNQRRNRLAQERRDFLKLSGVLGASVMLGMLGVVRAERRLLASTDEEPNVQTLSDAGDQQAFAATATPEPTSTAGPTAAVNESAALVSDETDCTVRCHHGCSYPGQCRKYVDANANGRCDLGECL